MNKIIEGYNVNPLDFSQNTIRKFVCVEVLRPSQPNGVMSSAVSLPNHTFTGQALSSKWLTSIVHILSPETDNCPSWISGRERMTVENISWSISTKECCRPWRGSNPRPPGLQSDAHPTEPPRPAQFGNILFKSEGVFTRCNLHPPMYSPVYVRVCECVSANSHKILS